MAEAALVLLLVLVPEAGLTRIAQINTKRMARME